MEIFKIFGIGIVTMVASLILKPIKSELAVLVSVVGGVLILVECVDYITIVIQTFTTLANSSNIDMNLLKMVIKIVGVGYLTEFAANICSDTGNSSLADKLMFAGKIIILVIALPIINSIIQILIGLMP